MSIITKNRLTSEIYQIVDQVNFDLINNASIDLRFSGRYRFAIDSEERWSSVYGYDTLELSKGELFLIDTLETVTIPLDMAGFVYLKSSLARSGLEHLHAGFIDPGFTGTITLEIENRHPYPLEIKRGQPIVQLVLFGTDEMTISYDGKYQYQNTPNYVPIEKSSRQRSN